jgi:hypothetical protein
MAELNHPPCHTGMTAPRLSAASFAGDSLRAQRTVFSFGGHAPGRGRPLVACDAARRHSRCDRESIAGGANRGRGLREGVAAFEAIKVNSRIEGEDASSPTLDVLDTLDHLDPSRPGHRPRGVPRAFTPDRTSPRAPHRRRPRLARPLRFPGGISARQRGGSGDVENARALRDVFGHTASISRRRTS